MKARDGMFAACFSVHRLLRLWSNVSKFTVANFLFSSLSIFPVLRLISSSNDSNALLQHKNTILCDGKYYIILEICYIIHTFSSPRSRLCLRRLKEVGVKPVIRLN